MRTFEFSEGTSNKFWNIELSGNSFTVTYGKIGTAGQTQTKTFADAAKAQKEYDKLVAEKMKKGYTETSKGGTAKAATPTTPPKRAADPMQRSLEDAIVENPADLASHSAYADYLQDQGDPRGLFIQTQLALENQSRLPKDRKPLLKRETELLKKHAKEWLGDAGRFLVGDWSGDDKPWRYRFWRGWPTYLRLLPFHKATFDAIARSEEFRLLEQLEIIYDMRYHPFDFDQFLAGPNAAINQDAGEEIADEESTYESMPILPSFLKSEYLGNLRVFRIGFSDDLGELTHSTMISIFEEEKSAQVIKLLEMCPKLNELYLNTSVSGMEKLFSDKALGQVKILQHYFGAARYGAKGKAYPLAVLAKNKSLSQLHTLRLHPGRDAEVELDEFTALVKSKNLPALKHLQVHMTRFGDACVQPLVNSGILDRLESLDLGYGMMTDTGAQALATVLARKNVKSVNVSYNALTKTGIQALKGAVANVTAEKLYVAGDDGPEFFWAVDVE